MNKLCLNCGELFEKSGQNTCSNCLIQFNDLQYNSLIEYAQRAVYYGYLYRLKYEEQIEEQEEITIKYSLLAPSNYYELLAVTVIGGIVGNFAYDIAKYFCQQIYQNLTEKEKNQQLESDEKEFIELISQEEKLNKFILYIKGYYLNDKKINSKVLDAVREEETVHYMTSEMQEKFITTIEKFNKNEDEFKQIFGKLYREASLVSERKRKRKPSKLEIQRLFKPLKTKIKSKKKKQK
jgi:hypothetical protein